MVTTRTGGLRREYLAFCALILMAIALAALAPPDNEQYRIDPASTSMTVHVGRSGLFGFAGHDHEVAVPAVQGSVTLNRADLGQSSVRLEFDAAALKVTGKGEPAGDVPEVQRVMVSERVLDVQRHPKITFQSKSVSVADRAADRMTLRIDGQLTLRGVTRPVSVPVSLQLAADRLTARGTVEVRQTAFGIKPVSAGAGTVKVKDEVEVVFSVTAQRQKG